MSRPSTNDALFERAKTGDREAFGELLKVTRAMLCERARRLLPADLAQKVSASDIFQETCVDALRHFGRIELFDIESLEGWLVRLLRNNVRDWRRRFKRSKKRDIRRERPLRDLGSNAHLLSAAMRDESSAESRAIAEESKKSMDEALLKLERGHRQIILWRIQERLSWQEIAGLLDRSEDAARMLWRRAIVRLRRELMRQSSDWKSSSG